MPMQWLDDVRLVATMIGGALGTGATAGLLYWRKHAKARAAVSEDAVVVAENRSRIDQIEGMQRALTRERDQGDVLRLRIAQIEERERATFVELQRVSGALTVAQAENELLIRRIHRLLDAPAGVPLDHLVTRPMELDDEAPK